MGFWLEKAEAPLGRPKGTHPEPGRPPTLISRARCLVLIDRLRGLSDPGDKAVERTHAASLMKSAVGGYEAAPVSGGNRQVEAVVYGDTVPDGELERCLSPRLGRVKLYWHP
jgi:hypothetical protein